MHSQACGTAPGRVTETASAQHRGRATEARHSLSPEAGLPRRPILQRDHYVIRGAQLRSLDNAQRLHSVPRIHGRRSPGEQGGA